MSRVVILGGGFGGSAAALRARELLPAKHEVVLIDRSPETYLCGANISVMVGSGEPASRSLGHLADWGVQVTISEIEGIDPREQTVHTGDGAESWDHLVVALGVKYDWDEVPGSRMAHTFYDHEATNRLRDRLEAFQDGSIVIGVGGTPYRCPPAPLEGAMMIDWALRSRGIRGAAEITVVIPEPKPLGVAGPEASETVTAALSERDIELVTGKRVVTVDGDRVILDDGEERSADIAITVPVHRVPPVVAEAGLTDGKPWVPVDPDSLLTAVPDVYAVGDVNAIPIGPDRGVPKAGVFASGQGRHVAERISAAIQDKPPPDPYDGDGYCFLSFGAELGARVGGRFLAPDGPVVGLETPSAEGHRSKAEWVASWQRFEV